MTGHERTSPPVPFRTLVDVNEHGDTQQVNFPDSTGAKVFVGATTEQNDSILIVGGKITVPSGRFAGYNSVVMLSRDDARALGQFLIEQAGDV